MANLLNATSVLAYRLRHSRIASIGFVLGLIVCIGLIALARADNWEDTTLYDVRPASSLIAFRDRYVRVSGVLARDQAYQTQADVGGLKLSGGRYLPLTIAGRSEPLFVYDANLPVPNADGTPFYPFGTTCYAWIHQPEALQRQTLESLAQNPFNKVRMCVFPKWYDHSPFLELVVDVVELRFLGSDIV